MHSSCTHKGQDHPQNTAIATPPINGLAIARRNEGPMSACEFLWPVIG